VDSPVASWENSDAVCEREAVRRASRILVSSFLATISAAFPLGQRIKGTWPFNYVSELVADKVERPTHGSNYTE